MSLQKQSLGKLGERLAAEHLQAQGFTVFETNWHCPHGEIDIVARHNQTWVFVEVRTRRADSTEAAFVSVNERKQQKLADSAHHYISTHDLDDALWRIDVIAVAVPRKGKPIIDHAEDALGW